MTAVSLARRSAGAGSLWLFAVGASAPLTVVAGAVVATYATTGVVGLPLSFLVLAAALLPLAVPYVAMARHVGHPAVFYALLGRMSGVVGVAAGWVSLLAYNAIQISLYGLLGDTLALSWADGGGCSPSSPCSSWGCSGGCAWTSTRPCSRGF